MSDGAGRVAVVGAGPGDPELLTVRGRRLLAAADVVVHDRLGTAELLPLCRPEARLIDAGKAPARAAMTQEEINTCLIAEGRAGHAVVRLKGGDPFVFGRGGEEAQALAAAGIAFEIVPGITSAIAAPAYAGIPVTHRGVATSFTVVTGHEDPAKPSDQTDWTALAVVPGTLVMLMAMGRLAPITAALIAAGRPADQPAAAVQWGTTARQRQIVSTLGALAGDVTAAGLGSPAVVVIGEVVALGEEIAWFARPLAGRRVVVTRARAQASELGEELRCLGAEVVELPTIRIVPIASAPDVDRLGAAIGDYRLLVLTSVNGVEALFARLAEQGRDARSIASDATIVAIGPATAERLAGYGLRSDVVPERFVAEGVLETLAGHDLAGVPALVARARAARPDLVDGLRAMGAAVDEVALYDTVIEPTEAPAVEAALAADYLTFTASSTARNFAELAAGIEAARRPRVVSIGPITSATAAEVGFPADVEATDYTVSGVIAALLADVAARA